MMSLRGRKAIVIAQNDTKVRLYACVLAHRVQKHGPRKTMKYIIYVIQMSEIISDFSIHDMMC